MTSEKSRRELNVDDAIAKIELAIEGVRIEGYQKREDDPKSFDLTLNFQGRDIPLEGHIDRLLRVRDGYIIKMIKDKLGIP